MFRSKVGWIRSIRLTDSTTQLTDTLARRQLFSALWSAYLARSHTSILFRKYRNETDSLLSSFAIILCKNYTKLLIILDMQTYSMWSACLPLFFAWLCLLYLLQFLLINVSFDHDTKTQRVSIVYLWLLFGCTCPLLPSDRPFFLCLVFKLCQGIYCGIIKLNQLIWPLILNQNQLFDEIYDTVFIGILCLLP